MYLMRSSPTLYAIRHSRPRGFAGVLKIAVAAAVVAADTCLGFVIAFRDWTIFSSSRVEVCASSCAIHRCCRHDTNHYHYGLPRLRKDQYVISLHPNYIASVSFYTDFVKIPLYIAAMMLTYSTSPHTKPHPPTPQNLQTRPPQERIRRRESRLATRLLERYIWRTRTPQWLHMLQPRGPTVRRPRGACNRHRA